MKQCRWVLQSGRLFAGAALPKGATLDAKREKRGISVYLVDDNGKLRHQLYSYAQEKPKVVAARLTPAAAADQSQIRLSEQSVKCSFTATPPGEDISIDGHYVGCTPSVLSLAIGDHTVEVSRPGFAFWKMNLTLTGGSQVIVSAVLQEH